MTGRSILAAMKAQRPRRTGSSEELLLSLQRLDSAVIAKVDWRDFESRCADVLAENGYRVLGSLWFRGEGRRYQIDLVACRARRVLCVDCKAWRRGGGAYRSKRAAEAQRERTSQLKRCSQALLDPGRMDFYPMVVTLRTEDMRLHEGTPVVPFQSLNAFLLNMDCYEDALRAA